MGRSNDRSGEVQAIPVLAVLLLLGLVSVASAAGSAGLKFNFYAPTCRKAELIVSLQIAKEQKADPNICASIIRLHFHDCFVQGCEGSVLLDGDSSEKTSPPNANSLRGFEAIERTKAALEKLCPGIVSCADVLALAARDCTKLLRGPKFFVPTGRLDGKTNGGFLGPLQQLPAPFHDIGTLESIFSGVGLDTTDLVVLSGAHSVGRARCITVTSRLFDSSGNEIQDPDFTPERSAELRKLCPFGGDSSVLLPMDATFRKLDTVYYKGIQNNSALFQSDHNLLNDPVTANLVSTLASSVFLKGFDISMVKMSKIGVLTAGDNGEVRRFCNQTNPV